MAVSNEKNTPNKGGGLSKPGKLPVKSGGKGFVKAGSPKPGSGGRTKA